MNKHICRVCGLYNETPPWGDDGSCPTYEYCPCCGVEFGYQDYTVESTMKFREAWLSKGANWSEESEKPMGWGLEEQLKNIPEEFT